MNLYLLKRIGKTPYDEHRGFVVAASSEDGARAWATKECEYWPAHDKELIDTLVSNGKTPKDFYGTDHDVWTDPTKSECIQIGVGNSSCDIGVVLGSFRAG